MAARDAEAAASAVLELEQAIADWTADTLQSDDGDHARRTLRGMVLELAGAARDGLADPAARVAPLVDALLERRAAARSARDFATADALRDRLAAAGVEVRDGPGRRRVEPAASAEGRDGGPGSSHRSALAARHAGQARGSSTAPQARWVIRSADGWPSGPSHRSAQATTNAMIGNVARPLSVSR